MLTQEHSYHFTTDYLCSRGLDPADCLFFDIETTGFRASSSHLYMIGVACLGKDGWRILQWMAEKPSEEALLLRTFAAFIRPYSTMIQFNGNRFDIPYLEEKYAQYGLPSPFTGFTQCEDLYVLIRPLKKLLGLPRLNQKTVESFLCLQRQDPYNGGELIQVYRQFVKTGDPAEADKLWLHNREDVEGMLALTALYAYVALQDPDLSPQRLCFRQSDDLMTLTFSWQQDVSFPTRLQIRPEVFPVVIELADQQVHIHVSFLEGTLLHFLPDWKDYYYLPELDEAYHKSVSSFADASHRVKARPENCRIRQNGLFLPQPSACFTPVFQHEFKDPVYWLHADESFVGSPDTIVRYAQVLMQNILNIV
ncbi:MAG: ribonuclease H-like domain-containing protein [Lachnospiraceae bacterium]|nr:ribonuclease H-like domain-containing protein [Lachnospiraceae bacterium]